VAKARREHAARERRRRLEARERRRRLKAREQVRRLEEEAHRTFQLLTDPGTPPEEAAAALLDLCEGFAPPPDLALAVEHDAPGRAARVARAALEASPRHPAALAFAAGAALAADDPAGTLRRYREAIRAAEASGWPEGDPGARDELRACLADALIGAGRFADALDELFPLCRQHPDRPELQELLADALHLAWGRRGLEPRARCPCGSRRRYGRCCKGREEAALARFADRSELYELREALRRFLGRPGFEALLAEAARDWYRGSPPEEMGDPAGEEHRIFVERALLTLPVDEDDEDTTVLDLFAADPGTPARLAARARGWKAHAAYGLWEVADPAPSPDVVLVDLVSGRHIHAAAPPEQLEGLPRWSVLMGALAPVEGIWRTGAGFLVLAPSEGRALADLALGIACDLLPGLMPRRVAGGIRRVLEDRRGDLRAGLPTEELEPVPEPLDVFLGRVVGGALPELRDALREIRARPMQVRNSDGEPVELISAWVWVRDRLAAEEALEAHPEFEPTPDGWLWLGEEVDPVARAVGEAQLASMGGVPEEGPRRWIRAHVGVDGLHHLTVEVNSRGRFERLLDILRRAGVEPRVDSERRVDPALDLPAPGEARPAGPGPGLPLGPEARAAWQEAWLDERVPALGGRTPREAAGDPAGRPLLEALLRELEFREDLTGGEGGQGPGVAALREALGMTAPGQGQLR
jgi:hypothetical protein